jgi:hypothetical protein
VPVLVGQTELIARFMQTEEDDLSDVTAEMDTCPRYNNGLALEIAFAALKMEPLLIRKMD